MEKAASLLDNAGSKLSDFSAVFGFDGFVDIIARPIKTGDSLKVEKLFSTIGEFGLFLNERAGKSCSVELKECETKIGGNTPICANALAGLGVNVACIGAFGYPEIHAVFKKMPDNCEIISIENPGICTALEFTDGKVMLALNNGINSLSWETVKRRIGVETLISRFSNCHMLGLFNWSEMPGATNIWRGILDEIIPHIGNNKWAVFDFSDCGRKSDDEISEVLDIVSGFGRRLKTVLSLNENEVRAVCGAMFKQKDRPLEEAGMEILKRLGSYSVVFHLHNRSIAFEPSGISYFDTCIIENPAVTTGAGDNFNAGLCAALLLDMSMPEALVAASMTASFYVANGRSPQLSELISFINDKV